jgi:hypothetical protein
VVTAREPGVQREQALGLALALAELAHDPVEVFVLDARSDVGLGRGEGDGRVGCSREPLRKLLVRGPHRSRKWAAKRLHTRYCCMILSCSSRATHTTAHGRFVA